jgi:hypothetical protein
MKIGHVRVVYDALQNYVAPTLALQELLFPGVYFRDRNRTGLRKAAHLPH